MELPAAGAAGFSAWQLVATSTTPTLIVCILGAVGATLAHKGTLNAQGCQTVARICFYVFTPALTFSKLAQAVSLQSIQHFWPLLANITISVFVGFGLGQLVGRLTRTPPELRSIVMCAVAFSNVGNLPLVFVSTLCHDKQALFYRSLGADCEHQGIAYTAFEIAAATLWQFTVGIGLIRRAAAQAALATAEEDGADDPPAVEPGKAGRHPSEDAGLPVRAPLRKEPTLSDLLKGRQGSRSGSASSSPREEQPEQHNHTRSSPHAEQRQPSSQPLELQTQPPSHLPVSRFHSAVNGSPSTGLHAHPAVELQPAVAFQPHPVPPQPVPLGWSPGRPYPNGSGIADEADDEDTAALLGPAGRAGDGGGSKAAASGGSRLQRSTRSAWQYLRAVDWGAAFPLPSQAAILGITVGCIPPAKSLLYSPRPPLRVLTEALDTLAAGLIPTTIPLLGAVLYRGPGASRLPARVTVAVLLTRLVLQPALSTGLVLAALRLRLFVSPDPMFLLILLLPNATPTAVNIQTMTVLYRVGEGEVATMLFWQYVASILTLPCWMWVFLRIMDAWQ
ncbi:hypothetical protein ABPG77_000804 [Micractinium sp. CCAP 211/92]